jgi:glycosyltransferase involved in cell wall biosynthesis
VIAKRPIAVSTYAAESIAPKWMRHKIDIVHHGVSEQFRAAGAIDQRKREKFLLMVSDIYIQKNFKTVIEALSLIRQTHPDIKLRIAGRVIDPVYYNSICEQIKNTDLSKNVEFLGSKAPEDIQILYASCRSVIFSSTVEAFGNPLVEAMASGCAVISSNTTAMPEVAGDAVLYFSPDNAKELAAQIERILQDDALCADLAERSIERAKDFSWDKTAAQTAKILIETAQAR